MAVVIGVLVVLVRGQAPADSSPTDIMAVDTVAAAPQT
jgi:hypothetical protein